MPTAKLGQVSSNEVSDLMQKHWDADQKIRELLVNASLDVKMKVASRLPMMMDEIKAEMARVEMPTA